METLFGPAALGFVDILDEMDVAVNIQPFLPRTSGCQVASSVDYGRHPVMFLETAAQAQKEKTNETNYYYL